MKPPFARKEPFKIEKHGHTRVDPYFWLKNKGQSDVLEYLKAENAYLDAVLSDYQEARQRLFEEMKSRVKLKDASAPVRMKSYYYYWRIDENQQYRVYCRKFRSLDSPEEVMLDVNEIAKGRTFVRVGAMSLDPSEKILAYACDFDGSESYTIFFRDLVSGLERKEILQKCYTSIEWAEDGESFLYTVLDESLRPYRLYCHKLGADPKADRLIYEESDREFFLYIKKSKDKKYIFRESSGAITGEIAFMDSKDSSCRFQMLWPRKKGVEVSAEHHGDFFYLLTNHNAENFQILRRSVHQSHESWTTYVEPSDAVLIEDFMPFQDWLITHERMNGLTQVRIIRFKDKEEHRVNFPEEVYDVEFEQNPEFTASSLRLAYSSPITPPSVLAYDPNRREFTILKEDEIPGGYDKNLYECRREFAKSHDGKSIPISLVYRKDIVRDGSSPVYLYGYGSYGLSVDPGFSRTRLSLLDRGFQVALAHIRGGAELGRAWYEDGKFLKKPNTFRDFISCAEHLIEKGYTRPGNIVIVGGSAGGMLIGASINMRPELFRAAVAHVPFVDCLTTMLDDSLPLTALEYDEWGNPNQKEFYDSILSYSPYDNVKRMAYPNILVTAGLNDPRVTYWEPAKWVAKLRDMKTDDNLLLLHTNMEAGHAGASGRFDALKEVALEYAFIFKVFQIPM